MLYLFHGTNKQLSLNKARALAKFLRTKRSDATFVEIGADDWNAVAIEEHTGGQGLFSAKYIIFLNQVTTNTEAKDQIAKLAEMMADSENIFIIIEGKLTVDIKKSLEKYATKTEVTDAEKVGAAGKREFNAFALADAFGARDAGRAWNLFRQAIDAGQEIEAIVGMLFWKEKTMSGSHPLLGKLITIYHDGHRGIVDMELATERLLLGLRK
ncbi:MAG: hypothetical protein WCO48_00650 [Candidatus Taylorbacteria bacterium]